MPVNFGALPALDSSYDVGDISAVSRGQEIACDERVMGKKKPKTI